MEDFIAGAMQSTFSIVVAGYLLVRMESRLDGLTDAITRLRTAIEMERGNDDAPRRH